MKYFDLSEPDKTLLQNRKGTMVDGKILGADERLELYTTDTILYRRGIGQTADFSGTICSLGFARDYFANRLLHKERYETRFNEEIGDNYEDIIFMDHIEDQMERTSLTPYIFKRDFMVFSQSYCQCEVGFERVVDLPLSQS